MTKAEIPLCEGGVSTCFTYSVGLPERIIFYKYIMLVCFACKVLTVFTYQVLARIGWRMASLKFKTLCIGCWPYLVLDRSAYVCVVQCHGLSPG
jgi:hypothetical protein